MTIKEAFASVATNLIATDPAVEAGRMLHSPGLRTGGRFFAFATPKDVVIKLPAARVAALISDGEGRPCDIRKKGSPMREWVRVTPRDRATCREYLVEARNFAVKPGGVDD